MPNEDFPISKLTVGRLADPFAYTEPVDLAAEMTGDLIKGLRMMLVIRGAEERIADLVVGDNAKCPCHLGIGQEAVAVGVSASLRKTDRIFGGHRSHSHFLAQGGDEYALFAEVLGKEHGCSKGMGGSMHLYDAANGFFGSVPIVAATVPLAVGAALAAQKDGRGDIGVSYLGDGAMEEGGVHESMNFAAVFKVPVLFVCENNFFSSHLHISLRQPSNAVARFAVSHHIPYEIVDGNDLVATKKAAARLIQASREGKGPGFLEAVTYRWRGHVGPSEDIDVGVKRKEDLTQWKRRDPVRRLVDALCARGEFNPRDLETLQNEVNEQLDDALARAKQAPYPPLSATMEHVYAGDPK